MAQAEDSIARELAAARDGSKSALGRLLETCRPYLLLIAGRELDPGLVPKGSASDLVQETFLEAQRDFAAFHGQTEEQLLAWLRRLLLNNVANFTRRYREVSKRQVAREVSLQGSSSSRDLCGELAGDGESPSAPLLREERDRAVLAALGRLPEEYRQVLLWRHQEGLPFEEIAQRMGRSVNAVQKLWARAIERMRKEMGESQQ
jgi:RNA polymerase sigma-70 factor (ECF subfamily)